MDAADVSAAVTASQVTQIWLPVAIFFSLSG